MMERRHKIVHEVMQGALTTMDTKDRMMRWLDISVTVLSLLIGVGTSTSAVSLSYTEASTT